MGRFSITLTITSICIGAGVIWAGLTYHACTSDLSEKEAEKALRKQGIIAQQDEIEVVWVKDNTNAGTIYDDALDRFVAWRYITTENNEMNHTRIRCERVMR